jgi:type II secretory pathway predicted ATPase ExeA
MYESFFQLAARPFLSSPVADRYFPAASIEHARDTVTRCVERAEGPSLILGSAGTGKSTLCQVIAQQMRERFWVAMLASARLCTRRALLQHILFELKLPYRDRDEGELRLSLMDALEPSDECPHGMLLIVDEAHMLPLRLLEEIRMITNLVRQGQPRVRLVLAAGMVLDERMASPRLESFNQRVAARCYLQSMNRDETRGYIRAQISAVGGHPDRVFTSDALQAVYRATDGIPRLVNQVCDHVLLLGAMNRRAPVNAAGVEEAWADLQQLPTPWTRDAADTTRASNILEFGQLDDDTCGELDAGETVVAAELAETPSPQVASNAATPLDQIENGIAALATEHVAGDDSVPADDQDYPFRPQLCREPEIELAFHRAHNPFAERFEEEELIVDPFASSEALNVVRTGPAGRGGEVRLSARGTVTTSGHTSAPQPDLRDTAFDPVLPDDADEVPATPLPRGDAPENALPGDDRDLLEIIEDAPELPEDYALAIAAYRPRRREYRQLFASLRGR